MSADLRCAVRTRARGDVPVATAARAVTHVLVETPLPWPKDLGATEVHAAATGAAGPGARTHGVVPAPGRPPARAEVVVHAAGPGPFTGYRRRAAVVEVDPSSPSATAGTMAEAVAALVAEAQAAPVGDEEVDLLVCTHGSRDRCCGSDGTALAARAATAGLPVHLRRASHLGGHRFAPTALHLPSGTTWAWLDDDALAAVVGRTRPVADLIGHYRGSAAVAHPAAQALEAQAFAEVGWAWLDGPRDAVVHGEVTTAGTGPAWEVEVTGAGRSWRAVVAEVGRTPQLTCGAEGETGKTDPVWAVTPLGQ